MAKLSEWPNFGLFQNGEWPWPFTELWKLQSANGHGHSPKGQRQNRRMAMAIRLTHFILIDEWNNIYWNYDFMKLKHIYKFLEFWTILNTCSTVGWFVICWNSMICFNSCRLSRSSFLTRPYQIKNFLSKFKL